MTTNAGRTPPNTVCSNEAVLEIRSYRLKTGSGALFHQLVAAQSVPLQRAAGLDVVAFGPSLADPDQYVLLRIFANVAAVQPTTQAFYASAAWQTGPRQAIVDLIETDICVVLPLAGCLLEQLLSGSKIDH